MTQTLNVEYEELMGRADEIEQPLPRIPSTNPPGPCTLSFIKDAAMQLALNADSMRLYLKACEREWKALAQSLRNAAKAYEEVDEESADAMNSIDMGGGSSSSGGTANSVGGIAPDSNLGAPTLTETAFVGSGGVPYYEVREAAQDIESGDQGAAFRAFAAEWDAFQRTFQAETINRFRPFTSWEGDARAAVETNFDQQRQWIISMVSLCNQLASQANGVVAAHKKATAREGYQDQHSMDTSHPTTYEVSQCDYWYRRYTSPGYPYAQYVYMAIEWYEKLQAKSEDVLTQYQSNAQIPLTAITPQRVPTATRIDVPDSNNSNDPNNPNIPFVPNVPFDPNDPSNAGYVPPTMTPMVPSAGTPATPSMAATNAKLDQALKGMKGASKGAGGVKPASFGGGAPGVPDMPLQPAVDPEAAARPAGAGPGSAAAGGLASGRPGGGAMGGGMGGMAPMGAGAGQQNAGKGKRVQSDDDTLYTEDREWTEGVIGNRPRKAGPGPGPGPEK